MSVSVIKRSSAECLLDTLFSDLCQKSDRSNTTFAKVVKRRSKIGLMIRGLKFCLKVIKRTTSSAECLFDLLFSVLCQKSNRSVATFAIVVKRGSKRGLMMYAEITLGVLGLNVFEALLSDLL